MIVAVIIPTYKEAGTIGPLLDEIEEAIKQAPEHTWSIIIVDANSPDSTGAIVRDQAAHFSNITLITEPEKRGIATAYVTGISHAIAALHADAFVEFDGDGQHDPRDIIRLVRALAGGLDCVVGSRYVPGGEVPQEWERFRKLLSRFGSLYARLLLELPVHDVTSGLKATRLTGPGATLPLAPGQLLTRDYAYKMQFLYALMRADARIGEVPIRFRMRTHDTSKSSWRDIVESLRVTAILRLQTLRQWRFFRVLAIGGVGFLFQAALFDIIAIELRLLDPGATVILVASLAMLVNFFLHERFSFSDKRAQAAPMSHRLIRFFAINFFGSICVQWAFVYGTELFIGDVPLFLRVAYVIGVGVGLLINYAGYYFWVWGRTQHQPLPLEAAATQGR